MTANDPSSPPTDQPDLPPALASHVSPVGPLARYLGPAAAIVAALLLARSILGGGRLVGMAEIRRKVAADAVSQYNIVARTGQQIDICVHAGIVAAAFLQALDSAQYRGWKLKQQSDCAAAGVPAR